MKPSDIKKETPLDSIDARTKYITEAVNAVFVNTRQGEEESPRYEIDLRADLSDIDNLLTILNAERKKVKIREIDQRSAAMKEAAKQNEISHS